LGTVAVSLKPVVSRLEERLKLASTHAQQPQREPTPAGEPALDTLARSGRDEAQLMRLGECANCLGSLRLTAGRQAD